MEEGGFGGGEWGDVDINFRRWDWGIKCRAFGRKRICMYQREIDSVLRPLELLDGPMVIEPIFVSMNDHETLSQMNLHQCHPHRQDRLSKSITNIMFATSTLKVLSLNPPTS